MQDSSASGTRPQPPHGFDVPLWRGIAAFRIASLGYVVVLVIQHHQLLARPWVAWALVVVMVAWTVVATYAYSRPEMRGWPLLLVDLAIAYGCLLGTGLAVSPSYLRMAPPLTTTWFAGAVLATSVLRGRRWGMTAALGYGAADVLLRWSLDLSMTAATPRGVVLLLLASYALGYMATLATESERRLAQAVELEARTRERERLARSIHDSVLQVLAMVRRRGDEVGGTAAELGRLAGQQEVALRELIGAPQPASPESPGAGTDRELDLRPLLRAHATERHSVATPPTEIPVPRNVATEVDAAVRAALDNVARHCPSDTRVWIFAELDEGVVTVAVRDDGPGIAPGRLAEAAGDGRLGVAQSIRGRIHELGGTVTVTSEPGEGTEVELSVPLPAGT
ncbi:DUF5931 domain-containing protein [Lipingzhangella sp. LS1_29]|uniref:DUF5931 domain-containing protein n=1 Tax=Lipingzhangella rawalii TaxID=2055835 RepID=A0ABU2H1H9_9ACTN|nr:DUF5931 domain-containing protein [Lipingzhangella rawalii]